MLVPIRQESFKQIIPMVATGPQYGYYWGKPSDLLRRVLISFLSALVFWIIRSIGPDGLKELALLFICISLIYWLWAPVYLASNRNARYRKYPYSGFWQGKVTNVFISEEVVREEMTVNSKGQLITIESLEKRINIEAKDETGFKVKKFAPLRPIYKNIKPGLTVECLIISDREDLSEVDHVSDLYLPQVKLWIGNYPYLRRDLFMQVSEEINRTDKRARYNN